MLTYAIGRFVEDRFTGLLSASLLATSPSFVLQLIQPMSDVPASAAWAAAVVFGTWGAGAGPALGSGLAVSSRFSSAPISHPWRGAVALLVSCPGPTPPPKRCRVCRRLVPGIVTLAAVNHALYGSPFLSGYGPVRGYFDVAHVAPNLVLYPRWIVETQGHSCSSRCSRRSCGAEADPPGQAGRASRWWRSSCSAGHS